MKFFCIFVPMFQPSNSRSLSPENFLFQKKVIQFLLTYKYLDLDPSVISAAFKLLNYFWIYFISSSFVLDFEEPHALNSAPQASIFCFGLAIPCMLSTPGPKWRTAVRPLYDHPPWRSSCTRGDYWRPFSMVMWFTQCFGCSLFLLVEEGRSTFGGMERILAKF